MVLVDKKKIFLIALVIAILAGVWFFLSQNPAEPDSEPAKSMEPSQEKEEEETSTAPEQAKEPEPEIETVFEEEGIGFDTDSVLVSASEAGELSAEITIVNKTGETKEIPIQAKWPNTEVSLQVSDLRPVIAPGKSKKITLIFLAKPETEGTFSGELNFVVSSKGKDKSVSIPIKLGIGEAAVEEISEEETKAETLVNSNEFFAFFWNTAELNISGKKITGWTIANLHESKKISIKKIRVKNWSLRDRDNSRLASIWLDGFAKWRGGADDTGEWIELDFNIPAKTSFQDNRLEFSKSLKNDFEQLVLEFEFGDGTTYKTEAWPEFVVAELWEKEEDYPQPLDFNAGIKSAGNTFGIEGENDGWDWSKNIYITGVDCVRFNADPNGDNSVEDSKVKADKALRIEIGDFKSDCDDSGKASGAYGIEFDVSAETIESIKNGGSAFLFFKWFLWNHELDAGNKIWLKSRIGTGEGMSFLGSDKDSGKDESSEFFYALTPRDSNGLVKTRITEHFTKPGTYYLELGVKLDGWNDGEWAEIEFDNIDIVFSESAGS